MANVSYRETLITYLRSETVEAAAKTLNISPAALAARIKTMKKAGVSIPKKTRNQGLTKLDVAQLNSIVQKHLKENKS